MRAPEAERFESSWLISPSTLGTLRAVILCLPPLRFVTNNPQSLYIFVTLFFIIGWQCTHADCQDSRRSFSYFTVLTYWGLGFYFAAAAVHSFARTLGRLPVFLQHLHSLFYTSVVTLPPLVTIVFWTVLYKGTWFSDVFDGWSNISQHGLNSAFAVFEIALARTSPPPWWHLLGLIGILLEYLAVAFITLADQGFYTYNFLDHDAVHGRGYVAAYVFGIAAGILVIFAIVYGLIWLRVRLTERAQQSRDEEASTEK